jgi:hypothetical protein
MSKAIVMAVGFLTFATLALGCDPIEEVADTGDVTPSDTGPKTDGGDEPRTWFAVLIADKWQPGVDACTSTNQHAEGADIDGVALFDKDDNLVGYAQVVVYKPGSGGCDHTNDKHAQPDDAKGAPDASLSSGYVALWGGHMAVEFGDNSPKLAAGDKIEVYEVGEQTCTGCKDEDYVVYLATDANCANEADWSTCAYELGGGKGISTFDVPAEAF